MHGYVVTKNIKKYKLLATYDVSGTLYLQYLFWNVWLIHNVYTIEYYYVFT